MGPTWVWGPTGPGYSPVPLIQGRKLLKEGLKASGAPFRVRDAPGSLGGARWAGWGMELWGSGGKLDLELLLLLLLDVATSARDHILGFCGDVSGPMQELCRWVGGDVRLLPDVELLRTESGELDSGCDPVWAPWCGDSPRDPPNNRSVSSFSPWSLLESDRMSLVSSTHTFRGALSRPETKKYDNISKIISQHVANIY